ncbi:MAG: hypothetical protein E5W09_09650 [Mesorhizobium sp.]|nr:MAG: hypothetical protein E5W09_09650 [Mesorhizobium sp.]
MRLAWLGTLFVSYQIVASVLVATTAFAQEVLIEEGATQRTFIAPLADKGPFREAIERLKKFNSPGNKMAPVEMPELGISLVTGTFSSTEANLLLSEGYQEPVSFEVSLFANGFCEGKSRPLAAASDDSFVPPSVCRVAGPPVPPPSGPKIWIIDSGVDEHAVARGLLNVQDRINCMVTPCDDTVASLPDKNGHGTMVAGIVGGMRVQDGNGYLGIVGVSPGVPLMIVKAFEGEKSRMLGPPALALQYVRDHADSGDILSISWGAEFMQVTKRGGRLDKLGEMDKYLFQIADKPVRIVIAAGNARGDDDPSWVQSFFPANAAEYVSPSNAMQGFIWSVSASESTFNSTTPGPCRGVTGWCDALWTGGSFGATRAEPGIDIHVLDKSKSASEFRRNICSGTSLAAPLLAGLLARDAATSPPLTTAIKGGVLTDTDQVGFRTTGTPAGVASDFPTCN